MGGSECGAFKRKHSHALLIALSAPHVFQSGNPSSSVVVYNYIPDHFKSTTTYITQSVTYKQQSTRSPIKQKRVQIHNSIFVVHANTVCRYVYACCSYNNAHFLFALHPVNIFKTWPTKNAYVQKLVCKCLEFEIAQVSFFLNLELHMRRF